MHKIDLEQLATFDKDVCKLQRLQNRAIRICLNVNNRQQVNNLHNTMDIPKLCERRRYYLK